MPVASSRTTDSGWYGALQGREASLGALIRAPGYKDRAELTDRLGGERLAANRFLRLRITSSTFSWEGEGGAR